MRTIRAMAKTLGPAMALDVFVPILTFVVASALGASEVGLIPGDEGEEARRALELFVTRTGLSVF